MTEPDAPEFDEEEDGFPPGEFVPLKWIADGVTTLGGLAEVLRTVATMFEEREREGWQLTEPVDNGFCHFDRVES